MVTVVVMKLGGLEQSRKQFEVVAQCNELARAGAQERFPVDHCLLQGGRQAMRRREMRAAEDQLVLAVQATEFTNQHAVAVGIVPADQALDRSHTIACTTGMQRLGKQWHDGPVASRCQHFAGYVPTSRHVCPHQTFFFKVTAALARLPSLPYRLISQVIERRTFDIPGSLTSAYDYAICAGLLPLKQELQRPLPQAKLKSRCCDQSCPIRHNLVRRHVDSANCQ